MAAGDLTDLDTVREFMQKGSTARRPSRTSSSPT
jgi:hypothetical protein